MKFIGIFILSFFVTLTGCMTNATKTEELNRTPFTHGNVQINLVKDVTTQSEVLEVFGPPNVATINSDGLEVWSYQKNSQVSKSTQSSGNVNVIIFGGSSSSTGFETTSRTMTLILKFDEDKVLREFNSMSSNF